MTARYDGHGWHAARRARRVYSAYAFDDGGVVFFHCLRGNLVFRYRLLDYSACRPPQNPSKSDLPSPYCALVLSAQVVRLRSAPDARVFVAEGEGRDIDQTSVRGSTSVRTPLAEDATAARAEAPQGAEHAVKTHEAWGETGGEWGETPTGMKELRVQVAQLEVLSSGSGVDWGVVWRVKGAFLV